MSRRPKPRTVYVAGAATIVVGLAAFLYLVTWPALWPKDIAANPIQSVFAVDLPQTSGSAWVWFTSDEPIKPLESSRATIRIWLSSTNPGGARIVLGGPIADNLNCYGDSITLDESARTFADLTEPDQRLVQTFLERMPVAGIFSEQAWEVDPLRSNVSEDAKAIPYATIVINSFSPDERVFEHGNAPARTEASQIGSFVCSFDIDAIHTRRQGIDAFTLPGLLVRLHMTEQPNGVYINRRFDFDRMSTPIEILPFNSAYYRDSTVAEVSSGWWVTDAPGPGESFVALQPESIAVERVGAERHRERVLFWSGVAGAGIVALLLAIGKIAADFAADSISKWAGRGPEPSEGQR